jgi:3-deoxy-D-manno-octulosonic acid kinase
VKPSGFAVPPGYVVHGIGSTRLVLDRDHSPALVDLRLADPSARRGYFSRAKRRGRGAAPLVPLRDGASVVLRRYRHGGLLGWLTGTLLLGPSRALSELDVTARAEASGAPVPRVLCLVLWPRWGPFWSAVIGTREEPEAEELASAWRRLPPGPELRVLLRRVGEAVRRLHDSGVEHPDLQVRNVLIRPEPKDCVLVIDLDRSRFHPRAVSPRRRASNLARLVRSAVKEGLLEPRRPCREVGALLGGYARGDRALRRELLRWARLERARLAVHRIGYLLRPRPQARARR